MGAGIRVGLTQAVRAGGGSFVGGSALAAATRTSLTRKDVVVDLEAAKSRATIVRGGQNVETPVIDPGRASAILDNFVPVGRMAEARSVRQTIAPGTLVSPGTAIDVEFLAPDQVTLGIFEGVHADLRDRNILAVAPLLQDPEVTPLLSKASTDLTAAERTNLQAKLATINVGVDDTVPERSLGAALAGLKTARAFR